MDCPGCGSKNSGVLEMNNIWCQSCGQSIRKVVKYVVGYNNQHYCPRQQVYNRLKRFAKWVLIKCPREDVKMSMRQIMNYFTCYEFTWHIHKKLTKRIYFFAKSVMLKVCCKHLGLPLSNLPSLKDSEREVDQMNQLAKLVDTPDWKLVCQSKLKPVDPNVSKQTGK